MSNITVFENEEFCNVEVVFINGGEWFLAKPITDFLGFSDAGQATRYLDEDEKTTLLIQQDGSNYKSKQSLINESGLYSLILRSRKPEAKKFKKWVTSEILPSIRKHGAYMTDSVIDQVMSNPAIVYKMAETMLHERKLREIAEAKIKEDEPKVRRTEAVIGSPDSVTIGTMATILKQNGIDIGQNRLYKILRKNGFLLSQHDRYNHPAQTWLNKGLFQLEEILVHHNNKTIGVRYRTRVTGKGQVFLVDYISNLLDSAI